MDRGIHVECHNATNKPCRTCGRKILFCVAVYVNKSFRGNYCTPCRLKLYEEINL